MPYNVNIPPNTVPSIDVKSGNTGRMTKEGDEQINVADWIEQVSTPGSGVSINIDSSGMTIVVEQDEGAVLADMENGQIEFQSDLQQGLDTLNKFHLVYNEVANSPGNVNDSATGLDGAVGEVDFSEGATTTVIDYAGAVDKNQWVLQSQTPIKFHNSGTGYAVFNTRIQATAGYVGNVFGTLVSRKNGVDTEVSQTAWNINTFLTSGVSVNNPAGIKFFPNRINTLVFQFPFKDSGDVKFGFFIGNKVVWAHAFTKQNLAQSNVSLVNNPLRIEGSKITLKDAVLRLGCFDQDSGYFFELATNSLIGSNYSSKFYSMSAYSYGAIKNKFYRTFPAGNEATLVPVTTRRPLVSILPKSIFPLAASVVNNSVIISLKELAIVGFSEDLNDGLFVEVLVHQGSIGAFLTGDLNFNSVDAASSVDFNTGATGFFLGNTAKQIYATPVSSNQGKVVLDLENVLSNFLNNYTNSHISAEGFVMPVDFAPTITVAVTSLSGNPVNATATLVWVEKA